MVKVIKRLITGEEGYIFAVTLILLMLGALLLPHLLSFMITGINTSQVYENEMYELYAADAGVEDAFWKLNNDLPSSYPFSYQITDKINTNTVAVTIEKIGIVYKITSIAMIDSSSSTMIESYVVPIFSIVDFAAASLNGDLRIIGTTTIDSAPDPNQANIYANGDISLNGTVTVLGDAVATGSRIGIVNDSCGIHVLCITLSRIHVDSDLAITAHLETGNDLRAHVAVDAVSDPEIDIECEVERHLARHRFMGIRMAGHDRTTPAGGI